MIRAYSQRLLPPYSGFVQIAESARARALSFDGLSWEFQYLSGNDHSNDNNDRVRGYALDRGYYNVASIHNKELKTFKFAACLDHDKVTQSIHELNDFLATAQVPFPAGDIFEYWLLDKTDESPLALIYTCCDESLMDNYPGQTEWTALPHSKMKVDNTEGEQARHEPPVNHRIQRMVANRAGMNARGAWFKRDQADSDDFPSLLIREDWQDEAEHDICQRYLHRKAPRLLMLHDLSAEVRERMEVAAREHVFEVEQYYPMYPAVNDERRMSAIRVEARMRRAAPKVADTGRKQKSTGPAPLDKDMRIIEN